MIIITHLLRIMEPVALSYYADSAYDPDDIESKIEAMRR